MTLAARIAAGTPGGWLVETGTERLATGDLEAGLAAGLAEGIALSIDDPVALLRLLAAADGQTAALLLLSPALPGREVEALMAEAAIARLVSDRPDLGALEPIAPAAASGGPRGPARPTDWLLTTSGTTGRPKIVRHRLETLLRTAKPASGAAPAWGLVYEPTRFAGLQVVLQALAGGGRLVALRHDAPMADRLALFARHRVTHLSATPTLWRRILMEPGSEALAPTHITLGGEIADRTVLDALARRWPGARIRHIYASTELGVGFSVRDGRPGFPAAWLDASADGVGLRLREGTLWLRPPGAVPEGLAAARLTPDADGYYPTGDRIEIDGERALFLGRDSATVNIGGTKIQPEAVERVLLEHPDIAFARIGQRPSPIAGALLTLTVVPRQASAEPRALRRAIAAFCRERLPREAMPARIDVVAEAEITAAGKLERSTAGVTR